MADIGTEFRRGQSKKPCVSLRPYKLFDVVKLLFFFDNHRSPCWFLTDKSHKNINALYFDREKLERLPTDSLVKIIFAHPVPVPQTPEVMEEVKRFITTEKSYLLK